MTYGCKNQCFSRSKTLTLCILVFLVLFALQFYQHQKNQKLYKNYVTLKPDKKSHQAVRSGALASDVKHGVPNISKRIPVKLASRKTAICSPHRKFVFVKTHKTASTSVYFMLLEHLKRYGTQNHQRAYPIPFIGGYPGPFDPQFAINKYGNMLGASNNRPDVVAGHLRFNQDALNALMSAGTKYITILREPSAAFYSSFSYYYGDVTDYSVEKRQANCFNSPYLDILGRFQYNITQYLRIAPTRLNPDVPWYFRSRNHQAHDLGLNPMREDQMYIDYEIRKLDSTFNLVMIAEYFLESLVLLREELCMDWSYLHSDIVNKGNYKPVQFTGKELSAIRSLNKLDYALYNHFNRTLWRRIEAYGRERMAQDIKKIRSSPNFRQTSSEQTEIKKYSENMEDVSKNFKGNVVSRLAAKIAISEKGVHLADEEVHKLAEYMYANSGGCNL